MSSPSLFQLTKSFRGSIGPTLKSTLATDGVVVRSLLSSVLALSEVMVVSGLLKLGVVETRMKMDQGGMYRQALRLGNSICRDTKTKATHFWRRSEQFNF